MSNNNKDVNETGIQTCKTWKRIKPWKKGKLGLFYLPLVFFIKDTILYQLKKNQRTQDKNSYNKNSQARKVLTHTYRGGGRKGKGEGEGKKGEL